MGDTKLERFLPKNQRTQKKWLDFEFWINGELSKSATFFVIDIFWWNQFLNHFITKMMPYFWQLAINPNSKFNHFLWVCWFLGKSISNFVSPIWKLHNPYCHILDKAINFHLFICLLGIEIVVLCDLEKEVL